MMPHAYESSTLAQGPLPETGTGVGTASEWQFKRGFEPWVVVLVILPAIALVTWRTYAREPLRGRARAVLMGLRGAALLGLVAILAQPVEVQTQERVTPPEVLVLVDDSASMSRRDSFQGDQASKDGLARLTGTEGETPSTEDPTRVEWAARYLEQELLPHLEERQYNARLERFAQGSYPLGSPEELQGRGAGTNLGDALQSSIERARGRHLTAAVLLSDGRSTGGTPALEAAERARAAGVPVHTVVVGDTRPDRNVLVELVEVPSSVLEEDEISVVVRVRGQGTNPGDAVEVVLEELSEGTGAPTSIEQQRVIPSEQGERVTLTAAGRRGSGQGATERRFRVSVAPLPEERMLDDNSVSAVVRVNPERIRVLYVEGYPRWEYLQLKDMLLRADERIEARMYLLSATPDFPQEATRGLDRLTQVPTTTEELLASYDVILLGDVNPWSVSPDPAEGERFARAVVEFVERGGGLCVISGEFDMPKAVAGTEFAKVLPVQLDSTGALAFEVDTSREVRPTLETPLAPHQIARLHPDAELNQRLWESEDGLRGFYWYYPVRGAKPGAQVILRHPEERRSGNAERDPLLVAGYHPEGRTLFLATDSTHRWQFRYEHRYHERFWRNAIRWLALGRLRGGDRRHQLESLSPEYGLDERVTLEARVLDEDFNPLVAEDQEVELEAPDGSRSPLRLSADGSRPGVFLASFDPGRPGNWSATLLEGGARVARADFEVTLPSQENANPSPDALTLAQLAERTGGEHVALATAESLLEAFPGGEERREPLSSEFRDTWDRLSTLLVVVALLGLEWALRKRYELI